MNRLYNFCYFFVKSQPKFLHFFTATTCMEKLTPSASAASQDNLVNVESTMMSSSTSRIVSTAYYDESGFKEDSTGKKIKFPIETYQGLEKATAERVRRFVDETRANLMRGRPESSPNLNSGRTTSGNFFKITIIYSKEYWKKSVTYSSVFTFVTYFSCVPKCYLSTYIQIHPSEIRGLCLMIMPLA